MILNDVMDEIEDGSYAIACTILATSIAIVFYRWEALPPERRS